MRDSFTPGPCYQLPSSRGRKEAEDESEFALIHSAVIKLIFTAFCLSVD